MSDGILVALQLFLGPDWQSGRTRLGFPTAGGGIWIHV